MRRRKSFLTQRSQRTAAEFAEKIPQRLRYFKAAASCRTVEMNVLVARVRVRSRR